jgi:hypothetical protein
LQRLHSSNWTTRNPEDNNSKGKQESLRNVATINRISDHPSLNLRKTLQAIPIHPAIPILPAPVTHNGASTISAVGAVMLMYHQRHGSQRKSMKVQRQTGNALPEAAETTKPTFVRNMASQAHLYRTPGITAANTANKWSAKGHSTGSSKKTSLPLLIFKSTGVPGPVWVRIRILGNRALFATLDEI